MRILVIGAAGMLGRKLVDRLARDGTLGRPVSHATLVDIVEPGRVADAPFEVETAIADLADPGVASSLIAARPDVVFHLAAVLSGEAEADFDKGYRVNLDGTHGLFEAIRAEGPVYCPRVVLASTIAVFGAPFPDPIGDDFCIAPLTSYGTQKAICELLLCDYTRRGFMDGVGIRLPTICVRPGRAEQGRLRVLLGNHPRAARRAGGRAARTARHPSLACVAARRRRLPRARGDDRRRARSATGAASRCPGCPSRWPSRSRRCARSQATARSR